MRLLIGEDEALLREGLGLVLAQHDIEIVGTSGNADELVLKAHELVPDLVLTDIRMPPTTPTTACARRCGSGRRSRPWRWCCCPSSCSAATRWSCWPTEAAGSATCSSSASLDVPAFVQDLRRSRDGGTALDPEVVSLMMSAACATTPPSTRSLRAAAGDVPHRRGPQQRGDRAAAVHLREGRRGARVRHLRHARPVGGRRQHDASWPSSSTSAADGPNARRAGPI